jgi:hypothetical protein
MAICFSAQQNDYNTISIDHYKSEESFIFEIQQALTISCSLPFTVPTKEIRRIINLSAEWFYKHSENAVEERYFVIPKAIFTSPEFACDRVVILPTCVLSVHSLNQNNGADSSSLTSNFDGTSDTSVNKFFFRDIFFSSTGLSNSSEALMYYIISASFIDLVDHVSKSPISYTFNPNSHKLHISGKNPQRDVILGLYKKVELPFLMNDEIFFRYVLAKTMMQLSRILGTVEMAMPGGATINVDSYKAQAEADLQEIIDEIKTESGSDFFFMTQST